jgi:hypothetical protein
MSNDIIAMAREAGFQSAEFWPDDFKGLMGCVERLVELARAAEREACAKVCDDWPNGRDDVYSIGVAIRART